MSGSLMKCELLGDKGVSYHCTSLLSQCLSQNRYAFDIAKDEGMDCIVCDGGS